MVTIDLKVKDSHALGALFYFIPINLSILFGASSPFWEHSLPESSDGAEFSQVTMVPDAPRGPLAIHGACLHLFQPNDCDETLAFVFWKVLNIYKNLLF